MKRIAPSFIGTTIATAIAALYTYLTGSGFHLWTDGVRALLLGGPIVVLMTYTVTSFVWEHYFQISEKPGSLGRLDYPVRIAAQLFLGLALAALSEDIRYYVIAFFIFVAINALVSWSSRKVLGRLVLTDYWNLAICAAYTWVALELYALAAGFEATYAAFITDRVAYKIRVNELRGEQMNLMIMMALVVGGMLANMLQIFHWPWKEHIRKANGAT